RAGGDVSADVVGEIAAALEGAVGDHRERRRELLEHRRPVDDEGPPRGEGSEPLDVVDLPERRAARGVDEAPEHRAERALEGRRDLARSVGEALDLADEEAGAVRRGPGPGAEVFLSAAAGIERVAAEPDGQHLEHLVDLRIALALLS